MYSTYNFEKYPKEGRKIFFFVISCALIYFLVFYPARKNNLLKNGKYVIAEIQDRMYVRHRYDPVYIYHVKGVTYSATESQMIQGVRDFSKADIGKRYLAIFDSLNPHNVCLLHENPVPDNVESPYDGWEEMPHFPLNKNE